MKFYTNVHPHGNQLLVRYISGNKRRAEKIPFKPSVWVTRGKGETPYKTLKGQPAYKIQQSSIKDAKSFVHQYQEVMDVHGQTQWHYQYMHDEFKNDIEWDKDLIKIWSIDIETEAEEGFPNIAQANEKLLLITLQDNHSKEIVTFGTKEYTGDARQHNKWRYVYCRDEKILFHKFMDYWVENYPDVITGWNSQFFDLAYLWRRMCHVIGEDHARRLSPWKIVHEREIFVKGNQEFAIAIAGIAQLDYLDLYKKYTYTAQESYRLDNIAFVELGEKKLDHSEYATFAEFYKNDWNKFVDYNVIDTVLVDRLEDKMKLIELQLTMAYNAKINYDDVFSQVRMWDMIVHNYLMKANVVIPPKSNEDKKAKFEGAFVKEPLIGLHKWVASFDLNSLYPHLIMQYNISPETLQAESVEKGVDHYLKNPAKDSNYAVAANGSQYRKDFRGVFPSIMEDFYNQRKIAKKEMLQAQQLYENENDTRQLKVISSKNNYQMGMKIALNSAYGAMGNQYFRYFDLKMAEAITTSGQLSIRWIHDRMNDYLNKIIGTKNEDYIIAVDTDSIYVTFEKLVDKVMGEKQSDIPKVIKFLDTICNEKFLPYINEQYEELANRQNAFANKMVMEREVLADKGLWTAKKRYVLSVYNSEGVSYKKPKMKIMGLEMIKSSTPHSVRELLKDAIPTVLHGDQNDLYKFIEDARTHFNSLPVEEIAFPRSVNGLRRYKDSMSIYKKATPIHVRGALLYNHYLKEKNITLRYSAIKECEKIKFVYLKKPNVMRENVISFLDVVPKEFGIHDYVDYDLMFEKVFLDPIEIMVQSLGWKVRQTASLEDFF